MATADIKYDFLPFDGTPGLPYDDFEERLLNAAASKVDDRGWSLADTFRVLDEGSAGGPAMPAPATADGRKAVQARRRRLKEAYGLLVKHVLDADHVTHMKQTHFQQGVAAFQYLQQCCQQPIDNLRLREMNMQWDALRQQGDLACSSTVGALTKVMTGLYSWDRAV